MDFALENVHRSGKYNEATDVASRRQQEVPGKEKENADIHDNIPHFDVLHCRAN